jgi:alternate signal-mediated exported protein
MTATSRLAITGAALVVAIGAGAATSALWTADGDAPAGVITSGDLDIALTPDSFAWQETSPDVVARQSGTSRESFAELVAMSGDSFTVSQGFTTTLEGDNMLGLLSVGWGSQPQLPDGVSATYRVLDSDDDEVASAPLGQRVEVRDLPVGSDSWTVEVSLDLADEKPDRYTTFSGADPVEITRLGTIVVDLDQVRTGTGFEQ